MRLSAWVLGLVAGLSLGACAAQAQDARGDWNGAIAVPGATLHIAIHIWPAPGGALTATLDSPDQGAGDIPVAAVTATGDALSFSVPGVAGGYQGKWDAAGQRWVGTWTQGGYPLPLNLERGLPPRPASTCPAMPPSGWPKWCDILIWTPTEQQAAYANMDQVFMVHTVRRGAGETQLPVTSHLLQVSFQFGGETLTTQDFMARAHASGVLLIHVGAIRLEAYQPATAPPFDRRWPVFSVTKSVVSTLLGAAIRDGAISSLDASVTDYLPELKATAYDGVTLRQLITMTSGVRWNENYGDPNADVAHYERGPPGPGGEDPVLAYMAKLPRAAPPGTRFNYSTGEATLAGMVVARAAHMSLADYLSNKLWAPLGMERDAVWVLAHGSDHEAGGWGLAMTLRDEGRFGLFILNGGQIGGRSVLPDGWIAEATANHNPGSPPVPAYGYYWWPRAGGFNAIGVYGQTIHIDPADHIVVVIQSAWPFATDGVGGQLQSAFIAAAIAAAKQPQMLK
jgi:CubicO group peptidase (beta-lactamase class C family)